MSTLVLEHASPCIGPDGKLREHVGVEMLGTSLAPVLPIGEPTPCERTEIFSTATDGQKTLAIRVHRGRSATLREAHFLGEIQVSGFKPGPRGVPTLAVTFRVAQGRIEMEARDETTDKPLMLLKR